MVDGVDPGPEEVRIGCVVAPSDMAAVEQIDDRLALEAREDRITFLTQTIDEEDRRAWRRVASAVIRLTVIDDVFRHRLGAARLWDRAARDEILVGWKTRALIGLEHLVRKREFLGKMKVRRGLRVRHKTIRRVRRHRVSRI